MREQRVDLRVDGVVDVLVVVDLLGLEEQHLARAGGARALLGEEVRVAGRDDGVEDEEARRCGGRGGAGSASTGRG